MKSQLIKNKYIHEINIVRAFGIIGVVMVHATATAISNLNHQSSIYPLYNFLNTFFRFGTPTFILLSSLVLFYTYHHKPLDFPMIMKFFKHRLLYILVPYLFFSVVYYGFFTGEHKTDDFWDKVWKGDAYYHLYFVYISVQFYLLFPFILWLAKTYKWIVTYAIWIGLGIQWGFSYLNSWFFHLQGTGNFAVSYFSFYMVGLFLGVNYHQIKDWIVIQKENWWTKKGLFWIGLWLTWLISSWLHASLWYGNRMGDITTVPSKVYTLLWNLQTLSVAIVLLQLAYVIRQTWSDKWIDGLLYLGGCSFGIYLCHPILHYYLGKIPVIEDTFGYHMWIISRFVLGLFGSWFVVHLCAKYVKPNWIFFGSLPKPKK